MISSYFKIAIRNFWRNKTFSFINIFGLAFGLACCLFIGLYIQNELKFDRFHKNADSIYRVAFSDYFKQGSFATTPIPIGAAMREQLPEVKAMARITEAGEPYLFTNGTNQGFEKIFFGDAEIFNVFSFPFLEGDPNTALKDPNSVVISEQLARKYFGNESALNRLLKIGSTGVLSSVVRGVYKTIPQNSHLKFDCMMSFATMQKIGWPTNLWRQMPGNYTYVLLDNKANARTLEQKLPIFVEKNAGEELKKEKDASYKLMLQPLLSIHLNSHLQGERPGAGNMTYVYLLAAIALIILIIACINFINFSTANAMQRMREIGVRKVIGAGRKQLVGQFLSESLLVYFLSAIAALLLAQMLLPFFNTAADRSFSFNDIVKPQILISLVVTGIIVGLIAGFFPAWSITRIGSIDALKGKVAAIGGKSIVSKILVTTQFVASIVLITSAIIVYQQMKYARESATSKSGDQVVVFQMNKKVSEKLDVLKNQLLANSQIKDVSASANVPGFNFDGWPLRLTENAEPIQAQNYVADDHYLGTMDLQLLAGRKLQAENSSDLKEGFVINETATKELGFKSPQQAIDQVILWGGDTKKRGKVIGVVKDFHITSLHEKISPAVIQFAPYDWMTYKYILVKIQPTHISNAIAYIKKTVADIDPNWPVDYKFFDQNFAALHKEDEQQGRVFSAFAGIAILISCLGLLGLTIYTTQRRVKEIGIRKVLGATASGIVAMLSKDFLKLVFIALIIASPIAWYLMNKWLEDFAYRVNITIWIFLAAGVCAIVIAFLTISFQAIKAAGANPIKNLRTE